MLVIKGLGVSESVATDQKGTDVRHQFLKFVAGRVRGWGLAHVGEWPPARPVMLRPVMLLSEIKRAICYSVIYRGRASVY